MKKTIVQEFKSKSAQELERAAAELKERVVRLTRDLKLGKHTVLKEYRHARKQLAVARTFLTQAGAAMVSSVQAEEKKEPLNE